MPPTATIANGFGADIDVLVCQPPQVIPATALLDIGIVVAGTLSRSWLDRLLVGSTAEALLDAVSCDLLLLKAGS